jgi:hypothetical protein
MGKRWREMDSRMGSKVAITDLDGGVFLIYPSQARAVFDLELSRNRPKMKRIPLSSLVLLFFGFANAHAGKPMTGTVIESDHLYPWESQRVNATEWTHSGDSEIRKLKSIDTIGIYRWM